MCLSIENETKEMRTRELERTQCRQRKALVEEDTRAKKMTDRRGKGNGGKNGEWKQTGLCTEKSSDTESELCRHILHL